MKLNRFLFAKTNYVSEAIDNLRRNEEDRKEIQEIADKVVFALWNEPSDIELDRIYARHKLVVYNFIDMAVEKHKIEVPEYLLLLIKIAYFDALLEMEYENN